MASLCRRVGVLLLLGVVAVWGGAAGVPRSRDVGSEAVSAGPVLANVCLITGDMKRLVGFYEAILGVKATWSGPEYAELRTGSSVLAIFSYAAQQRYIPDVTEAANNKSVILEFRVDDADREYSRLRALVSQWVKPPTTQLWGTRSIYFRDPDGNLVDFFTPPRRR